MEEKKLPIKEIFYNSLAYKNGLLKGDIILKYNNINVTNFKAFTAFLKGLNIGDSLVIEFIRNGKKITKTIRIEDCPKKLPFSTDSVVDGKIKTIKGGNTYFYGEKFLLWQQSSKTKLILELDKVRYDNYNNLYNYVYIDCGVIQTNFNFR